MSKKSGPAWEAGAWTPVRRGDIYCSPACGGKSTWGCTWHEYQKATTSAKNLARSLGENWRPEIWENLGWHYKAISPCGRIKVHPSAAGGYMAFLGSVSSAGGRWVEHGRTPAAAIRNTLQKARADIAEMAGDVKAYSDLINIK